MDRFPGNGRFAPSVKSLKEINLRLPQMHVDPRLAHAFTLFTGVCFCCASQLRPKTDLVG